METERTQEIVDKVRDIISRYSDQLAEVGIKCSATKRFYETEVEHRYTTRSAIEATIDFMFDSLKESKYKNVRNRYHCIILRFTPVNKISKEVPNCKEYVFMLHKTERIHIGLEPEEKTYKEEKILNKIEKRIQKILRKANYRQGIEVCKDTLFDALRYISSTKYDYKDKILGIDSIICETIYAVILVLITLGIILLAYWLTK